MATTEFKITGMTKVLANLARIGQALPNSLDNFFEQEAKQILADSLQQVPHEYGALESSGRVNKLSSPRGYSVSYGHAGSGAEAYALAVHELPPYHTPPHPPSWVAHGGQVTFHGGGGHKYLERPFRSRVSNIWRRVASHLAASTSGVVR